MVSGRNWNSSKLSYMSLLPTRMKMIHIKNEGAKVVTTFFPLYLSEILWLSSLPVSMKKIRSKIKALACSQRFPHYNQMGAIRYHGHPKPNASFLPTQ